MKQINNFSPNLDTQRIAWVLIIIGLLIALIGIYPKPLPNLIEDLYPNLATELISIGVTVLIIDRIREKRSDERERKMLISQIASPFNILACDAIRIIRNRGWTKDLIGIPLWQANLENGDLHGLNLSQANFGYANLKKANLCQSILDEAVMTETNLEFALLHNAKLRKTMFFSENQNTYLLKGAELKLADLSGATFKGNTSGQYSEDEQDIQLHVTRKMVGAIFPNGKRYDGRYNLIGDISDAKASGHIPDDPVSMAKFYEVSSDEYREGQQWYSGFKDKADWYSF